MSARGLPDEDNSNRSNWRIGNGQRPRKLKIEVIIVFCIVIPQTVLDKISLTYKNTFILSREAQ